MNFNWKFWKKKTKQDFNFWSVYEPLNDSSLDYLWPQPASNYFPEWFKQVPRDVDLPNYENNPFGNKGATIKKCPVFPEFMTQGFIIPMWVDFKIIINPDLSYNYSCPIQDEKMHWDCHPNGQFIDWLPEKEKDKWAVSLKASCPWKIKTPPGWSTYQFPLFYHFNEWTVLPGSIRTDHHYDINQQVLFPKSLIGQEIFIPRGTPFAWYIPYKRTNLKQQKIELNWLDTNASWFASSSKFENGYKIQSKIVDKKNNK